MFCLGRPYRFKFFNGCLPQILLGPFLNTLPNIVLGEFNLDLCHNQFSLLKECYGYYNLIKTIHVFCSDVLIHA